MENNSIANNIDEDDDTSLLVIIVDCNIYSWGNREKLLKEGTLNDEKKTYITFSKFLEHLMVFINAYLMLNQENQLSVLCSKIGKSEFLFPNHTANDPLYSEKTIQEQILHKLQNMDLNNINETEERNISSSFSAAMSMALCYISRIKKATPTIRPRIVVFNVSPDVSAQYISVMNCIFSAQKQSIPVDCCILSQTDSTFLQQASHLTNGVYLKPQNQQQLTQYLLSTFLIDTYSRKFLAYPTLKSVDYRASCFCHKKIVDIGFVCSVCLSIFCKYSSSCSTCGTKFSLKIELPKKTTTANNTTTVIGGGNQSATASTK
ncbi:hypothetical protein CYY_008135 [Polysphondylium violaceum]|uniref:General transcription factor IIH subunit 3 n=1 Tax=Polysphondylium violaceum TaxID=133409 RepID=A0A8J4UX71_9MYCE|nr:hypothetical protein CYY_008135 [Polysphondylium violaceum]